MCSYFPARSTPAETGILIVLLELISAKSPATQILFLVKPNQLRMAMSALKAGSYHYTKLPIADQELKLLIETALEQRPEYAPNLLLKEEVQKTKFEQMVGGSTAMHQVYRQIRQAAATEIPVYISGETGTRQGPGCPGHSPTKLPRG